MPSLRTVSDSDVSKTSDVDNIAEEEYVDEEDDWFSEVGDDSLGDDLSVEANFKTAIAAVSDEEEETFATMLTEIVQPAGRVDLSYRDQFITYHDIPPKSFTAANKQKFPVVATGEMIIEVPDGFGTLKMKLTEVLYSPEIRYTLISIRRLNNQGFTATFGDGKCEISHKDDGHIGTIPRSSKGLYQVIHESVEASSDDEANTATAYLTPIKFHCRMGHISPVVVKCLIMHGFITGVTLDTSTDKPVFCESCVFTKSRHQPVPKVREGERATEFGAEVHSDIWGPAPVQTIRGRRFFISFTDDYSRLTHLYLMR